MPNNKTVSMLTNKKPPIFWVVVCSGSSLANRVDTYTHIRKYIRNANPTPASTKIRAWKILWGDWNIQTIFAISFFTWSTSFHCVIVPCDQAYFQKGGNPMRTDLRYLFHAVAAFFTCLFFVILPLSEAFYFLTHFVVDNIGFNFAFIVLTWIICQSAFLFIYAWLNKRINGSFHVFS